MYKYVLSIVFIILSLTMLSSPAGTENWFDSEWYTRRSEEERESVSRDLYAFPKEDKIIREPDKEEGVPYYRMLPPKAVYNPKATVVDSVKVEEGRVLRERNIPGIRMERYQFIPLDSYVDRNLDYNFDRLWQKEITSNMKDWTTRKEGGIKDLDFSIPVGQRFESLVGGKTSIKIDGSQRIEFSGRSEYDEGVVETATTKNSSFPSLNMKQEPRFNIRGNIGERITVDIKQDSQTGSFSNLEENISLKYKGEDHDIIKYIEAGNTSLSLKGATFAGYTGTHKGLFGIRTEAQLGALQLTAIASQEKGESGSKTFRGSAEEALNQIRDYNYKANTYFFIDFAFRHRFEEYRDDLSRIIYEPADSLQVMEVWVNDGDERNDTDERTLAYPGQAWPMDMAYTRVDGTTVDEDKVGYQDKRVEGFYHKLDPGEYYVNRSLGFIQFRSRVPDEWTVGVFMVTARGDTLGSLGYDSARPDDTFNTFKLVKRKGQRPTDERTWDLEWKNVYDLGQRNIDLDALEIKIYREATDGVSRDKQDGVSFIHILGLDNVDEQGNPVPDQKVDYSRGFVDRYRGELIFPLLRPFDSAKPPEGVEQVLNEKIPEIYDASNMSVKEEETKYYIEVKTANRQATINIGGFGGILEDSESVYLNGKKLNRGSDYRINYMTGEVTLLNEEALSPNADLKIDYQEQTFVQPMQKTLLGVRGEYSLFNNSKIGAVFLFNNESTQEKRVRLGNEPSRTMLFDMDTDLNFEPEFLTRAVDRLPGVVASAPSTVQVQAEFAKSMPNMNTHGEVYIDDFEGSQNTPLSIMRGNWTPASPPMSMQNGKRGRIQWYNPWDRIDSEDIWPNKKTSTGENTVHVLNLAYGMAKDAGSVEDSYAGVQNSFWGSGVDLSRARFIEIWARGSEGKMKIDIGSISEDFYPFDKPNGDLDTEDKPIPGQGHGDGILVQDEDTGLDGVFDRDEPGYSKDNPDPSGDNWDYDSGKDDYLKINGMEGNARDSDRAGVPDTEDINHNGILDTRNAYYEYTIDFDPNNPNSYLVEDTIIKPDGTKDPAGWRLFRIPLWNNSQAIMDGTIDTPDSTLIEFARMWITGTDSTIIQIASIEIVESNWIEQGIYDPEDEDITGEDPDEVLRITTVNTHENPKYNPPPGVKGELDRDTKIRRKEQALVMELQEVRPGNTAYIYRNFEKMDFTDYTKLKFWVHGPDEFPMPSEEVSPYELIVRFGGDKNNYYEYRTPIFRDWAYESAVEIDFATCTELKLTEEYGFDEIEYAESILDSLIVVFDDSVMAQDVADSLAAEIADVMADSVYMKVGNKTYALKGNPSLNNVRVVSIGVKNNDGLQELTNDVWINEMRLDDLRDMGGMAYRAKTTIDMSGFVQISADMQTKEDDFHGMNAKKGSGKDQTDWSGSAKINLDRFTPRRWKLSLPVSYNYRQSEALPRLKSGSDIILPDSEVPGENNDKIDFRDYSWERKGRISYKKGHDTTKSGITGFVTEWAFEKVSADYDWGDQSSVTASRGDTERDNQRLSVMYDVDPKAKGFTLLGWMPELPGDLGGSVSNAEFFYTPSALNYTYKYNEDNTYTVDIDGNVEAPKLIKTVDEKLNFTYGPFKTVKYTYVQNRMKDLTIERPDKEVVYEEDNKISITGPEILNVKNKYDYTIAYDEDNDPKYSLSGQLGSRTVQFNKQLTARADFEINKFLEERLSGRPRPSKKSRKSRAERPTWGEWFGWLDFRKDAPSDSTAVKDRGKDVSPVEKKKKEEKKPPRKSRADSKDDKKNDDDGKDGKDDKKNGESLRTRAVMAVAEVTSPISIELKTGEQLNYSGITGGRPGLMYRLGIKAIPEPDTVSVVSSRNTSSVTDEVVLRTRLMFPGDVSANTSATFSNRESVTSSVSQRDEKNILPSISMNWSRLEEKIPFVDKYFSNLNLNSNITYTTGKNWQNEVVMPQSETKTLGFAPLFSINTKVLEKYDFSFSFKKSLGENLSRSGDIVSVSYNNTSGTSTKIGYRIDSSSGIPLFKKLKLKSDIDLDLEYETKLSTSEREVGAEERALIKEDTSSSLSLRMSYQFSQKLRGGGNMLFSSSENITKKVHKVREIGIWCELRF